MTSSWFFLFTQEAYINSHTTTNLSRVIIIVPKQKKEGKCNIMPITMRQSMQVYTFNIPIFTHFNPAVTGGEKPCCISGGLSQPCHCSGTFSRSEYPIPNWWGNGTEFSSSTLGVSTLNYHTLDASYHNTCNRILTIRQNSFTETLSRPIPKTVKSSSVEE